jgi:hypothetical protein
VVAEQPPAEDPEAARKLQQQPQRPQGRRGIGGLLPAAEAVGQIVNPRPEKLRAETVSPPARQPGSRATGAEGQDAGRTKLYPTMKSHTTGGLPAVSCSCAAIIRVQYGARHEPAAKTVASVK